MELAILNKDINQLTPAEQSFKLLHESIVQNYNTASGYLYQSAKSLMTMKATKAYEAVGITTFEDYTTSVLGIKKSQAYSYISIAEKYSDEFFHLNGKLGITKLNLLTALSEDEAQQVVDELQDAPTTDYQALIEKLKKEKETLEERYNDVSSINKNLQESFNGYIESDKQLLKTIHELKVELEEAKNKKTEPKEIITEVAVEDTTKIEELQQQLDKANKKLEASSTSNEEIKSLQEEKKRLQEEKDALAKKLTLASNTTLVNINIQLKQAQTCLQEAKKLTQELDADTKTKVEAAIRKVASIYA